MVINLLINLINFENTNLSGDIFELDAFESTEKCLSHLNGQI